MTDPPAPHLLALLQEDWRTHGCDWTKPGFRAVAVNRLGRWRLALPQPFRLLTWWVYRFLYRYVRNHYQINLEYTVNLGRQVQLGGPGNIVIHKHATIGDGCLFRQNVTVGAGRGDRFDEAPRLGANVELGAGAVVVGGVVIGDGARIGPNAVVMNNVPANAMVLSPAAKVIPPMPRAEAAD
jgi:serine O-acetyltransferase